MKYLIFLFTILFFCEITYSDIVPENSHRVDKCVKIINIDDFPEYTLIAYVVYPTGDNFNTYKINPSYCLELGYKFNNLYILAIRNSDLAHRNLDTTDWLKDKKTLKPNIEIHCGSEYVSNNNPTSSIDEYYKLAGFTDTTVILYKYKELIRFINGQPAFIRTYKYNDGKTHIDKIEHSTNEADESNNLTQIYTQSDIVSFLIALFYTILIETIVLFIIFKTRLKKLNIKNKALLLTGLLTSFATLPYVWFVLPIFIKPTWAYMFISELSVVLIESVIILKLLKVNYKQALTVSFICNLISFLLGLLINMIEKL